MTELLKVAIVQTDIYWEEPLKNLSDFQKLLESLTEHPDLIVFPEMFTTGFLLDSSKFAEPTDGRSVAWMKNIAAEMNLFVAGSIIIRESNKLYNRFILAAPNGTIEYYDKRHLFTINGGESDYEAGSQRKIFNIGKWRICPQICYDLRFPVWSRNRNDYDVLIYVANWPKDRREAWKSLLVSRAIENLSYCIGVNRIGKDGNGIEYAGESMVVNAKGQVMNKIEPDYNGILYLELSLKELEKFRNDFPAHKDADTFWIEN